MKLTPIDDRHIAAVAGWLAAPANAQWLHFGAGAAAITAASLKVMAQRDLHVLRVFCAEPEGAPIGLVAFSDVDRRCRTAALWYVVGEERHRGRGFASRAVAALLTVGFSELGLEAVSAWVVDGNAGSRAVLERNGFRFVGRQRRCHRIEGHARDRLLYDLLSHEHEGRT